MGNIKKSNQELQKINEQYLSDRNLQLLNKQLNDIVMRAIPIGMIKDGAYSFLRYDEQTQFHIDKIKKEIADYTKINYHDIFLET
jgi:hypothetical protein